MAKNVSYQTQLDGSSSGVIHSNPLNNPEKTRHQNMHSFNNDYQFYCTERYADISPFYVSNGIPKDVNPLINTHELRTYTLSAPLMSDVYKHKNYFQVPMKAILPKTWDYIFTNPVQGDDVPSDAYTSYNIMLHVKNCLEKLVSAYGANRVTLSSGNIANWFPNFLRCMVHLESILSTGSLLSYMGFSSHAIFRRGFYSYTTDFDSFFDEVVIPIIQAVPYFTLSVGGHSYVLDTFEQADLGSRKISLRRFLEMIRENPIFFINIPQSTPGFTDSLATLNTLCEDFGTKISHLSQACITFGKPIDYSRLVAYQLVCAHFFTNDSVDFIYNADLFRKNAQSLLDGIFGLTEGTSMASVYTFDYNGVSVHYDTFSARFLSNVFYRIEDQCMDNMTPSNSNRNPIIQRNSMAFASLIFAFRKSLKNGDYFTGSKPFPLAVGDVKTPVVNNTVSAIDMTVNISKQRFLNAVNRFGSSVDDYITGIFNSKLPPVDTDPKWLSNQSFQLFGTEVENTGAEQRNANSVTTIVKSNGGKYAFESYCDVPSIYLGLTWYEIKRAYTSANDRFFFHKDRYDMFNPYMQYVGDQEIYPEEISTSNGSTSALGYTTRYMEYKQRFNRACGGFVGTPLRTWATLTSFEDDAQGASTSGVTISPDFIRSSNVEFDPYYSQLTGYSLGHYFHFILKYNNFNNIKRAMDYAPTIL